MERRTLAALALLLLPPSPPSLSVHGGPAFHEHWGTGPQPSEPSLCLLTENQQKSVQRSKSRTRGQQTN